jgi:hypothetical protein
VQQEVTFLRAFESRKKINPEFKVEILAESREQRESARREMGPPCPLL